MTNQTTKTILAELDEVCTAAWNKTVAGLTPEELEAAKKITLREWAQAIVTVVGKLGTGR